MTRSFRILWYILQISFIFGQNVQSDCDISECVERFKSSLTKRQSGGVSQFAAPSHRSRNDQCINAVRFHNCLLDHLSKACLVDSTFATYFNIVSDKLAENGCKNRATVSTGRLPAYLALPTSRSREVAPNTEYAIKSRPSTASASTSVTSLLTSQLRQTSNACTPLPRQRPSETCYFVRTKRYEYSMSTLTKSQFREQRRAQTPSYHESLTLIDNTYMTLRININQDDFKIEINLKTNLKCSNKLATSYSYVLNNAQRGPANDNPPNSDVTFERLDRPVGTSSLLRLLIRIIPLNSLVFVVRNQTAGIFAVTNEFPSNRNEIGGPSAPLCSRDDPTFTTPNRTNLVHLYNTTRCPILLDSNKRVRTDSRLKTLLQNHCLFENMIKKAKRERKYARKMAKLQYNTAAQLTEFYEVRLTTHRRIPASSSSHHTTEATLTMHVEASAVADNDDDLNAVRASEKFEVILSRSSANHPNAIKSFTLLCVLLATHSYYTYYKTVFCI